MSIHTPAASLLNRPLGKANDILIDCDGVLLDWLEGFQMYARLHLGLNLDPEGPSNFNLTHWLGVADHDETVRIIDEFNAGISGHFSKLPVMPGAAQALNALHQQGRDIHVITSCSTHPDVVTMRRKNLESIFGRIFNSITHIDLLDKKAPLLEQHVPAIWVEDNFDNAIAGARAGHRTFLIRSPHNRSHEADGGPYPFKFTWVDGLADVIPLL